MCSCSSNLIQPGERIFYPNPHMLSIAACTSYQSIVGSQKYLRTAPFCAGEMQCIVDAESQCLQFICPIDYRLLYKYAFGYLRRQYLNPPPAFQIRRLLNLEVKYLTSLPTATLCGPYEQG